MLPDVDEAARRLQALLRPRVGKRMTAVVMKNLAAVRESGDAIGALRAIHQTLDAYARIPESGTPFPLDVARAIGDCGCPKLPWLRLTDGFAMGEHDVRAVGAHADALLPTYGEDDADFALRVAWKSWHHYRLHLVVGRALERNDATPTTLLHDAWVAQGEPASTPIGVVSEEVGVAGVVYAVRGAPSFVFSPMRGDNVSLDDVDGVARFLAMVPLRITPRTLAWLCHLVRMATRAPVDVEGGLVGAWQEHEDEPRSNAASLLLGLAAPPVEERASIVLVSGGARFTYAPGELAPA